MSKELFLLINLALAFYNVGTIWAHEVDIFRSWKLLDPIEFKAVQTSHWHKLPYWVFAPVGLQFIGSIILIWYHPDKVSILETGFAFGLQFISALLTMIFWGPWQAKLAKDELGSESPWLSIILKTHWLRTALINAYGFMIFFMTTQTLS